LGPIWHFPLPPLGNWFLSELWPVSISPTGVFADSTHSLGRDHYPPRPGAYVAFADIRGVEADGRELIVNGHKMATTASETSACRLVRLIESLAKLPKPDRSATIGCALEARFDAAAVRRRIAEHGRVASPLRRLTNGLFLWIFVFVPLVAWPVGWLRTWPYLLAGGVFFVLLVVRSFLQSYAALFPNGNGRRGEKAAMMVLNPLAAIRAHDELSRDVLAEFHPLAAAHVLCSADDYRQLARAMLVDLRHPLQPVFPDAQGPARDTGEWFRRAQLEAVSNFVESTGLDPAELLAPDPQLDATCRTYCPRCRCQFVLDEGCCLNCGGIALLPLRKCESCP
jgi:hypothetical protein